MKMVKGISLLLIYSMILLGAGFYAGVQATHFFYPEQRDKGFAFTEDFSSGRESQSKPENREGLTASTDDFPDGEAVEVSVKAETLCVDTEYVLKETNVLDHTEMETVKRLPDKYVGMNREQFLEVMETYEAFPPLSEQERGFTDLEVLSFSRERVVVQMNYRYIQPSAGFYLAVYNNMVWVYLEDMETVYIETDIRLDSLPEELQQSIIQRMWVENQRELYNFLENYSS